MPDYKGITFRKGYKDFAEFKAEMETTHVFKAVPHKEREKELKKAFEIAKKKDADTSGKTTESKKIDAKKASK